MADNSNDIGFIKGYNVATKYINGSFQITPLSQESPNLYGIDFQSMYDMPSNLFRYQTGLFEDPLLLIFELQFDNDSPLFDKTSIPNFLTNYYNSDANRNTLYENFIVSFFKIFRFKFNWDYDKAGYGNVKKDYYILNINGLDNLTKKIVKYPEDKLTITLRDDVTMLSQYMIDCYNNLAYSYASNKCVIPENLLRFNMKITVKDLRNFKIYNLTDKTYAINENISEVVYKLYDCNLIFYNSKNFTSELKNDTVPSEATLAFDIIYKSYAKISVPGLLYNGDYKSNIIDMKEKSNESYLNEDKFTKLTISESDMSTDESKTYKSKNASIYNKNQTGLFNNSTSDIMLNQLKDQAKVFTDMPSEALKTAKNLGNQLKNMATSSVLTLTGNIRDALLNKLNSKIPLFERTNVYSDTINDIVNKTLSHVQNKIDNYAKGLIDKGLDSKKDTRKMFDINTALEGKKKPADKPGSLPSYPAIKPTIVPTSNKETQLYISNNSIYGTINVKQSILDDLKIIKDQLINDKTIINPMGSINQDITLVIQSIEQRMLSIENILTKLDYTVPNKNIVNLKDLGNKIPTEAKIDLKSLNYSNIKETKIDLKNLGNKIPIETKVNLNSLNYSVIDKIKVILNNLENIPPVKAKVDLKNLDNKIPIETKVNLNNLDNKIPIETKVNLNSLNYSVIDKIKVILNNLDYKIEQKTKVDLKNLDNIIPTESKVDLKNLNYTIEQKNKIDLKNLDYTIEQKNKIDLKNLNYETSTEAKVNLDSLNYEKQVKQEIDLKNLNYETNISKKYNLNSVYDNTSNIINKNVILTNIYKDAIKSKQKIELNSIDDNIITNTKEVKLNNIYNNVNNTETSKKEDLNNVNNSSNNSSNKDKDDLKNINDSK